MSSPSFQLSCAGSGSGSGPSPSFRLESCSLLYRSGSGAFLSILLKQTLLQLFLSFSSLVSFLAPAFTWLMSQTSSPICAPQPVCIAGSAACPCLPGAQPPPWSSGAALQPQCRLPLLWWSLCSHASPVPPSHSLPCFRPAPHCPPLVYLPVPLCCFPFHTTAASLQR